MNKFIYLLILISVLVPTVIDVANVNAATSKPEMVVASYNPVDSRAQALQNVFERYNSPLTPYAAAYVKTADKYNMDWRLLPAIAGLESTFGRRQLSGSYNSYGWGGGRIYFTSVEDGMDKVLYGLKTRYVARGATTVESIAPIYAASPTWAPRIRRFMALFDAEYERIQREKLALTL